VDGLGDHFLAGATFALNQNRGAAGRHLRHQIENLQHNLALAHYVAEVVALLEGALELQVFFFGFVAGNGGAYIGQQFFVVPGLLDKVFRAGANGLDDVVHCAVGGDHDNRQLGMALLDLRQQLEAALAGQRQVQQHQVEAVLIENPQPLNAVAGHFCCVPFKLEQHIERLTDGNLIVNDQNMGHAVDQDGIPGKDGYGRIQRRFYLRHERNSSTGETQDGRLCRRRWHSRHESCRRAPG